VATVEPCGTCKWALVCGGGCTFKAVTKTGDVMSPNCAPFEGIYAAAGRLVYETAHARARLSSSTASRAASMEVLR
jgi:sulfatase maturation enzyme AslB (radical SAM superfamily)